MRACDFSEACASRRRTVAAEPERIADRVEQFPEAGSRSGHRGGKRSHQGPGGRTYRQLYNEAKAKGIKGRSKMTKKELLEAVG